MRRGATSGRSRSRMCGSPILTSQGDPLGALGLVVNAIDLWNTRYLDRAVN